MDPQPAAPPPAPEPPKAHPIRRLVQRMGLGAFTISLVVHSAFLVVAVFYLYKWVYPPEEKIDFLPGGGGGGGSGGNQVHKIQSQMRQRMVSSSAVSKRIASTSTSAAFVLPDASNELMDAGLPLEIGGADMGSGGGSGGGHGTGKGTGIGSGSGPGKGFGEGQLGIGALIPTIMKGRCTDSERLRMLREAGGTQQVEDAIRKSLQWLKAKQNPDGSWGGGNKPAMTGFALLCYLGHCESTQSGEYGDTVTRAITWLVDFALKNNGRLGTDLKGIQWVYEHAVATYALAEALTFSRTLQFPIPELEPTVQKAADIIIKGQTKQGGWDYRYADEGRNDLSVAGWQLQALKAAKASGVPLEGFDDTIRDAMRWLTSDVYCGDGKFGYTGKDARPAMTAVAALCLQHWDKASTSPARAAVKLIMDGLELRGEDDIKKWDRIQADKENFTPVYALDYDGAYADLYATYYAVQAMRNAGGKEWDLMNKAILEEILPAQNPDGSFKPEKGGHELAHSNTKAIGEVYLQTLNTLILEVYYRFLPATSAGKGRESALDGLDELR